MTQPTTTTLDVMPTVNQTAGPLPPPLREYWELRRRQLIAELKAVEKILGIATKPD